MSTARTETLRVDAGAVTQGYRTHLFQCAPPYYDHPLVLVRGRGVMVEDANGAEYLDFFSGILTTSVGHCHPEVVAAVQEQAATLGHISTLYLSEQQVDMARRLAQIAPGRLTKTFFTNSGTEAVETAVILACLFTGRSEVIALRHSYSGRSVMAANLTGHAPWRLLASAVPGIKHVMSPYPYRCPFTSPCDATCIERFAADLEDAILTTTTGTPAALFAETIQGVGGYIVPPRGYFQAMVDVIRRCGGVFICDEVQTGFGRTGGKWFGIEHWDVEPDIMVMAKGIANGFPVGATMTRPEIADAWTAKTISTFGGNPVAMAAGIATNQVMVREDTPARCAERGTQLCQGLAALQQEHGWIGDVRGMGLMQALELVEDRETKMPNPKAAKLLLEAAKTERLLVGVGGLHGQVIRLGPSMLVGEGEVADALDRLGRACRRVATQL